VFGIVTLLLSEPFNFLKYYNAFVFKEASFEINVVLYTIMVLACGLLQTVV
jgi:hypothetical protein